MTEPERRLTPEMCEYEGQSEEHAAWIAEWKRAGAPPGSLRYAMRTACAEMNAEVARQGWPASDALPTTDPEDCE